MTRQHRDRVPERVTRDPSRRGMRLVEEHAAYFALVNQGIGSREAARQVGVARDPRTIYQALYVQAKTRSTAGGRVLVADRPRPPAARRSGRMRAGHGWPPRAARCTCT